MELTKLPCWHCGAENRRNEVYCPKCRFPLGPLNVNLLSDPYFGAGLDRRYADVQETVAQNGKLAAVEAFEAEIVAAAQAVINMDARLLFHLVNESDVYLSYQQGVEQNKRRVLEFEDDVQRCVVETSFYAGYTGRNVVYAAMSLDDDGVRSYGDVSVVLRTDDIEQVTTVFEKDTIVLFNELTDAGWRAGTIMPAGYCGVWSNRGVLAVVKHGAQVAQAKKTPKTATLVLHSDGKKQNDEYIELHIFNGVTPLNFAKVKFHKKLGNEFDEVQINLLKHILKGQNTEIAGK